jgi:hypothetical protein
MTERKTSLIAGLLFAVTFLASIPAVLLYGPVLDETDFILGSGGDLGVSLGAALELVVIVANLGTALVLYPVLKRRTPVAALSWVAARIMECTFIAVGVITVLSVLTLRQDATANSATLVAIGESLVAVHNWTFWIGPGIIAGIGNGMLLGYMAYKSELVPRGMAMLGLIGGPMICASGLAVVLGIIDHESTFKYLSALPEIAWEASLTIYLIAKGFRGSPAVDRQPRTESVLDSRAAASTMAG